MKIDNFALTMFQTCPIKYFLRMKEGWTTRRKSAALGFGGAIHEGLAVWHRTADMSAAVVAIDESWPNNLPIDDWRTKEKCISTLVAYMKAYPKETFQIIGAPESPLVEHTFTIDTGMTLDGGESIEYGGIFDGGIEFSSTRYVLEHKTTSQMGTPPYSWFFQQFKPNNQITGYIWALRQLTGERVGGAIINAIGINKSSPCKFDRQITTRSDEDIEHWLKNVRETCQQIADCERRGFWPWHTQSCTMYGKCEYHDVHTLGAMAEQEKFLEQMFVKEPWSYEARDDAKVAAE